jgi:hypothetical protein
LSIYSKARSVLNPFIREEEISKELRNWDLWGPFVLVNFHSLFLSYSNADEMAQKIVLVYTIFWLGGIATTINGQLLGVKM